MQEAESKVNDAELNTLCCICGICMKTLLILMAHFTRHKKEINIAKSMTEREEKVEAKPNTKKSEVLREK